MKLTFDDISKIDDDIKRNDALYTYFQEENRLMSRAGNVEFITTIKAIEAILKPGDKILDVGAGTGVYAFPLAEKGHHVTAFEPAQQNYDKLKRGVQQRQLEQSIKIKQASSLDLDVLPDNAFDIVLLFGPLYHLTSEEDRQATFASARRVCKKGGYILTAYINHDMVFVTETSHDSRYFDGDTYHHDTMRLINRPFVFFKLSECKIMLEKAGLSIKRTIASDGFAELLAPRLNEMSETAYHNYLKWHFMRCEQPEHLGASSHFLFVCENK